MRTLRAILEAVAISVIVGAVIGAVLYLIIHDQKHGYRCFYCGREFDLFRGITQDHLVPLAAGGNHTKDNMVPACASCNAKKRDTPVEIFLAQKKEETKCN